MYEGDEDPREDGEDEGEEESDVDFVPQTSHLPAARRICMQSSFLSSKQIYEGFCRIIAAETGMYPGCEPSGGSSGISLAI